MQIPPQEFIGGLFPRKFITLVAAPSGTGKTLFTQKCASDLSVGGTFFDGFAENEPVRKVLIFAGEAGYEMLIRRGASFKWEIDPDNVKVMDQHECEMDNISLMLDDEEGWNHTTKIIDLVKPDIVFWDTFSAFHDRDENKAVEMKPILRRIAKLAEEKNFAAVLNHHSRKRAASERNLSLSQDDVIGSSILNRLVALIIGIEPSKDVQLDSPEGTKKLIVKPLKSWFAMFSPFAFTLEEDMYGHTHMQTDLAPSLPGNSKQAVWNYLQKNFSPGKWFSFNQFELSEIEGNLSERQVRRILSTLVTTGKLQKRGATKSTEYYFENPQNFIN